VQHVAVLPIGGSHITNDLAIGLKTDLDVAEAVKLQHASLLESKKTTAMVSLHGKQHSFAMDEVHMITEARMEELFEYVDKELQRIRRSRKLPGGVVLNGGTAKLPGIAEYARERLQLAARVGKIRSVTGLVDTVEDPTFITAVGLLMLDMLLPSDDMLEPTAEHASIAVVRSLIKKIGF
jgi:cell division protein FtsA